VRATAASTVVLNDFVIRSAQPSDAAALLAIYRPYVEETVVSFEIDVPTESEFAQRIVKSLAQWGWLVAEHDGQAVGYASASAFRDRAAYRWSAETSAYVDARFHRHGIGRSLYAALLTHLADKGYCTALAGIALPNEGSIALHRGLGFEPVGVFKSVGRKFDRWHDVSWWQRSLEDMSQPRHPGD